MDRLTTTKDKVGFAKGKELTAPLQSRNNSATEATSLREWVQFPTLTQPKRGASTYIPCVSTPPPHQKLKVQRRPLSTSAQEEGEWALGRLQIPNEGREVGNGGAWAACPHLPAGGQTLNTVRFADFTAVSLGCQ